MLVLELSDEQVDYIEHLLTCKKFELPDDDQEVHTINNLLGSIKLQVENALIERADQKHQTQMMEG